MKIRALLLIAILSSGLLSADAQIIDVTQKVKEMLTTNGPVSVSRNSQTNFQVLTASKIRIAGCDDVHFDAPVRTELPEQPSIKEVLVQNNSDRAITTQIVATVNFKRTEKMQFQKGIKHLIQWPINYGGLNLNHSFNLSGQIIFGAIAITGTVHPQKSMEAVTRSRAAPVTLKPHTAEVVALKIWPVHYSAEFRTTVVIDADLRPNAAGHKLLSEICGEPQRKFEISGTIEANDASEGEITTRAVPFESSRTNGAAITVMSDFISPVK